MPTRIVVFRALFLGDMLCAVPALRALRRRFPDAEIVLIGLPWARELLDRLQYVDRIERFPGYPGIPEVPFDWRRTDEFLARLRAERFDLAVQLHGDGRTSNAFVAELGARVGIGFSPGERDDRLTLTLPWEPDEHETRRWLRLVGVLGAETGDDRLEFPVTREEDERAAALLRELPADRGPVVGLHPGAKEPARRWPVTRFARLAEVLGRRYGARIVVTGGPAEAALAAAIHRGAGEQILDLTGRTAELGVFGAVLGRLDLLVTNDTGASHLAAALGTRSVVLFGPSRPARWAPLDRGRHLAVDALAHVRPGTDPAAALARLPVEPVLAACDRALAAATPAAPYEAHPLLLPVGEPLAPSP